MKAIHCFVVFLLSVLCSFSQSTSIIPQPQQLEIKEGSFPLHQAKLIIPADAKAKKVVQFFNEAVQQQTGMVLSSTKASSYTINFVYKKAIAHPEGYEINISS